MSVVCNIQHSYGLKVHLVWVPHAYARDKPSIQKHLENGWSQWQQSTKALTPLTNLNNTLENNKKMKRSLQTTDKNKEKSWNHWHTSRKRLKLLTKFQKTVENNEKINKRVETTVKIQENGWNHLKKSSKALKRLIKFKKTVETTIKSKENGWNSCYNVLVGVRLIQWIPIYPLSRGTCSFNNQSQENWPSKDSVWLWSK